MNKADTEKLMDEMIDALKNRDVKKLRQLNKYSNNVVFNDSEFVCSIIKDLNKKALHNLLDFTLIGMLTKGIEPNDILLNVELMIKAFEFNQRNEKKGNK